MKKDKVIARYEILDPGELVWAEEENLYALSLSPSKFEKVYRPLYFVHTENDECFVYCIPSEYAGENWSGIVRIHSEDIKGGLRSYSEK